MAAPVTFNCTYDSSLEEIDYEVIKGEAYATYIVDGAASGSIKLEEDPPDIETDSLGNGSEHVGIECTSRATGNVTLTFKKDEKVVHTCTLSFSCTRRGATPDLLAAPTLTEWGLIGLSVLLAGSLAWMIRRRVIARPTGA